MKEKIAVVSRSPPMCSRSLGSSLPSAFSIFLEFPPCMSCHPSPKVPWQQLPAFLNGFLDPFSFHSQSIGCPLAPFCFCFLFLAKIVTSYKKSFRLIKSVAFMIGVLCWKADRLGVVSSPGAEHIHLTPYQCRPKLVASLFPPKREPP